MHSLSVAVLGPFQASLSDQTLDHFRTKSVQALLVYLLVEGGAPTREWLTELIWPGLPPASGRKNLRQTLYELRQLIPEVAAREGGGTTPLVLADRQTIRLNPEAALNLDLDAFERQVARDEPAALAAAAALYRGDFLSDFYLPDSAEFEEWTANRRAHYRRQVLEALERLARFHLDQGDYSQAETYARRQLALDELRETAVRQLMRALAAQGQRSAALRVFEDARQRLAEALQVEPDQATVSLHEQIQAGGGPAVVEPYPSPVAAEETAAAAHNLARPATPLVGRRREMAELAALLAADGSTRLVTLLGPGGSGKTRLAQELAFTLAQGSHFPDGVWFVPLAALSEPAGIVAETAKTVGFSFSGEGPEPRRQLLDYLRARRLLLVLDNYEHLLGAEHVPLPADILTAAPGVRVLVTSRTRLNVHGEQLFPLAGLAAPAEEVDPAEAGDYEAVTFFAQCARRLRPDFALDDATLPAVTSICRLVEGLPLALEMAAAWLEVLPPEAIAAEIERGLDILAVDWQDMPARQRSLRAVFDSSWQLLGQAERGWLKRLAVFRGGFARDAAEAVADLSLRGLLALVHKSWLARQEGERYQLHELLRQYAYEKLTEDPAAWRQAREKQARYFAGRLAGWNQAMRGAGQKAAFDALAVDFENIRNAWRWLMESGDVVTLADRMAAPLLLFCGARSREDDLAALIQAAQAAGSVEPRTDAILQTAMVAAGRGYYAIRYFQASYVGAVEPMASIRQAWRTLHSAEAGAVDGLWLVLIATLHGWNCDRLLQLEEAATARRRLLSWKEAWQQQGDRWAAAFAAQNLGRLLSHAVPSKQRHLDSQTRVEAQRQLTVAAAAFAELGDQLERAHTLRTLGQHLLYRDPWQAGQALREARSSFLTVGDPQTAAHVLWDLAQQSLWAGKYEQGFTLHRQLAEIYESLGNRYALAHALSLESINAVRYSNLEHARATRLRCLALRKELGDHDLVAWDLWELGELERVAGDLDAARRHFAAARQLFDGQDNDFGLLFYQRALADLALDEGDARAALALFEQALQAADGVDHEWTTAYLLAGQGRAARALGHVDTARRSLQAAVRTAQDIGHDDLTAIALVEWAALEAAAGRPERALALAAFIQQLGVAWRQARERAAELAAAASAALPEETATAARRQAQTLTMTTAVSWVLEHAIQSEPSKAT